jgi:NADPH-dependent curcumin reductase CurA
MSNRMVKLARRPKGMVKREDFTIEDGPVPEPGAGEMGSNQQHLLDPPCVAG